MRLKLETFWTPDFTGAVVREVLRWVYMRAVDAEALAENAKELLDAAQMFLMPSLVREVERELLRNLNHKNVFSTIELADRYQVGTI